MTLSRRERPPTHACDRRLPPVSPDALLPRGVKAVLQRLIPSDTSLLKLAPVILDSAENCHGRRPTETQIFLDDHLDRR